MSVLYLCHTNCYSFPVVFPRDPYFIFQLKKKYEQEEPFLKSPEHHLISLESHFYWHSGIQPHYPYLDFLQIYIVFHIKKSFLKEIAY